MNTYKVFRIILGLIASFFILYFMIYYSGVYSGLQENTQRMMIATNFRKAVEDVYVTGNPVVFDDFSILEFKTAFNGLDEPSYIWTQAGETQIMTPLIFVPGDEVVLQKKSMDFGWWKFDFVEALPEMTILFNPMEINEDTRGIMRSITDMLPETTGITPKVSFGFCDGNSVIRPCNSGTTFCDGFRFISEINFLSSPMSRCTISDEDKTIVTISQTCSGIPESGVCIATPDISGIGYAYLNDTVNSYVYRISYSATHSNNPMDLVALVAGADKTNKYGPVSEGLYTFMNRVFLQELEAMSIMASHRAKLISVKTPPSEEKTECGIHYINFWTALDSIPLILSDEEYYKDPTSSAELLEALDVADIAYQNLVNLGCEYEVD